MSDIAERGLTKKEFAERIRVSIPTVNRMIKAGTVRPCKIGTRVIFREHHVTQVLDAHDTSKQTILSKKNLS